MNKKIVILACIVIVSIVLITNSLFASQNTENFEETFFVDAVYFEQNSTVKITFEDKSEKTTLATLEVLGMEKSSQKKFETSSFVENIALSSLPKYGWSSIPVTLVVEHSELGKIGIKTEIHPFDNPKPRVIFSKF